MNPLLGVAPEPPESAPTVSLRKEGHALPVLLQDVNTPPAHISTDQEQEVQDDEA